MENVGFAASCEEEEKQEVRALVDRFDAAPLTLQQLTRIAVRRAVGGEHCASRVRSLSANMPPLLLNYVADPTEQLISDEEVEALGKAYI